MGLDAAYELAKERFNPKGVNRIIIGTDGDFNVGTNSAEGLEKLMEVRRTAKKMQQQKIICNNDRMPNYGGCRARAWRPWMTAQMGALILDLGREPLTRARPLAIFKWLKSLFLC